MTDATRGWCKPAILQHKAGLREHLLIKNGVEALQQRPGSTSGSICHPQLKGTPWRVLRTPCSAALTYSQQLKELKQQGHPDNYVTGMHQSRLPKQATGFVVCTPMYSVQPR